MANDYVTLPSQQGAATVYASQARTATPNGQVLSVNRRARGMILTIDMTAVTATGTVTFAISGLDTTSGKTWTILTSAALAAVATTNLKVTPDLANAANLTAQDILPATVLVTATHGNGVSMTYSVGVQFTY